MKKTELIEVKKGKDGYGLLIENDGYAFLKDSKETKQIKESIENGEWTVPYPFVVDAVFQKFGVKNANGRIYPEDVLKKQVEVYQERINERRAYGECYKPDAMVLSADGWKPLSEIKEGDIVLTLNPETNQIEKQPVSKKIEYDFVGDMIHIHNRNIDDVVTPNHGYPIYDRNHRFAGFKTAEEIMVDEDLSTFYIPIEQENIEKGVYLDKRFINVEKEAYNGKVMCIEVPNHIWYVMCNNKCHWTKNCNHPAESTIDLGRVSHNIIELHWEGRTLVGKMELNISEGFRKYGICSSLGDTVALLLLNGYKIGVSSRGVGSVEQKLGQYIVGDDFELICWDVVSDPSTPNAYISTTGGDEMIPWLENDLTKTKKSPVNEKIEKINKILTF